MRKSYLKKYHMCLLVSYRVLDATYNTTCVSYRLLGATLRHCGCVLSCPGCNITTLHVCSIMSWMQHITLHVCPIVSWVQHITLHVCPIMSWMQHITLHVCPGCNITTPPVCPIVSWVQHFDTACFWIVCPILGGNYDTVCM